MDRILSRDDAIQEHLDISYQLKAIIPNESNAFFIEFLSYEDVTEYFGLSFANQAVASIFHEEYIGVDDSKLRIK